MKKKLYEKLKVLRKELNLSQEYVANFVGVHRTTITAIENGSRKVNSDELKKFSDLYGITSDELLNDRELDDNTRMFARAFSDLSEYDKSEIINLIQFKKRLKLQDV